MMMNFSLERGILRKPNSCETSQSDKNYDNKNNSKTKKMFPWHFIFTFFEWIAKMNFINVNFFESIAKTYFTVITFMVLIMRNFTETAIARISRDEFFWEWDSYFNFWVNCSLIRNKQLPFAMLNQKKSSDNVFSEN